MFAFSLASVTMALWFSTWYGSYESKHAFLNDIGLMCANCRAFNTDPDNDFVACANKVEAFIRPRVEAIDVS